VIGDVQDWLGQLEQAHTTLEAVFYDSLAAARDETALQAALWLVFIVGYEMDRYDDALHWAQVAQSLVTRLAQSDNELAGELNTYLGDVHQRVGKHAQAIEAFERAIAIRQRLLGPDNATVAQVQVSLAVSYAEGGDLKKARALLERCVAIMEAAMGE